MPALNRYRTNCSERTSREAIFCSVVNSFV